MANSPSEELCRENASLPITHPLGVGACEVQNMDVQMVPTVQDEVVDSVSVMPYCTVLSEGNEDAETSNSESNHGEVVSAVSGQPYSPPEIRRPFKPSNSKRQQLIAKEAAEIYLLRPKSKAGRLIPRGSMAHCKVMTDYFI